MNRSAKRQHHEQARKEHRHNREQQARILAKRPRPEFPVWLLVGGIGLMLAAVIGAAVVR